MQMQKYQQLGLATLGLISFLATDVFGYVACITYWYLVLSRKYNTMATCMFFIRSTLRQSGPKFFHFLPISYLIDIRTAKFLENVVRNDNCVCRLFSHNVYFSSNFRRW